MRTRRLVLRASLAGFVLLAGAEAVELAAQAADATPLPAAPVPAAPTPRTLAEFTARPELWPARVTLNRDVKLEGGVVVPTGTELALREMREKDVLLDGGDFVFECPSKHTDVLERCRAFVATLTPEQAALTWAGLRARTALWPLRVTAAAPVEFEDGTAVAVGDELVLRGWGQDALDVCQRGSDTFFTLDPRATDVLARARERLLLPPEDLEPFFIRAVEAALLRPEGSPGHPLAGADYVLVWKARRNCEPCAAFAAELARFLARMKASHPRFECVLVSSGESAEDARAFVAGLATPGWVVAHDRLLEAATTATLPSGDLPGVFVLDRRGTVLHASHPHGGWPTPLETLTVFEHLLATPPAEDPIPPK